MNRTWALLLVALAVVQQAAAYSWDPGYPRSLYYPVRLAEDVSISGSGIAYAVQNVRGSYQLNYWVGNQPGRHAKHRPVESEA